MESYPIFKKENIDVNEDNNFSKYLSYTDKLVDDIQFNSIKKTEIPLSFYPIAKNIRFPASFMTVNILNNQSSFIENKARSMEEDFWKNYKQMGDWFPWLWARGRIPDNYTNYDGWKFYFDSFTNQSKRIANSNESVEPPNHLMVFFTYLSCSKYVFQLNETYRQKMDEYMSLMDWPVESKILAVQIRRGETCTKDGSMTDRPFYHLQDYIEKITKMLESNRYEYIYISTDSNEELNELKRLKPDWKLLYLPIDRSQFFRMNNTPVDLEVFCCLEPQRIPFIVDSGLADLYFISKCQGYISTMSVSEFSRCGWFLQIATQNRITPYINMNDEVMDMRLRDKLLML
jgi:hypothetical protein